MSLNINLSVDSVEVAAFSQNFVDVTLFGVSEDDLLEKIDIKDTVSYYGDSDILDYIGKEEVMAHFGLVEEE